MFLELKNSKMNSKFTFLLILLIVIISCGETDSDLPITIPNSPITIEIENENVTDDFIDEPEKSITQSDIQFCDGLIDKLTGIERYVILGNYNILSAVLRHNGDTINSKAVNDIIFKRDGNLNKFDIKLLDTKSGFMVYAPIQAEVTYTTTYWNLADGGKLICTEEFSCGPVCSSGISFMKFMDGMYNDIEINEVIPEYENINQILFPDYNTYDIENGDPLEFKFNLPQKGKDITYCLGDDCIILEWNNESFSIKK